MWSQPGAKQTPKAFHGVDVYFVDTVSISVAGILALTVIDRDMNIAPGWETSVRVWALRRSFHRASAYRGGWLGRVVGRLQRYVRSSQTGRAPYRERFLIQPVRRSGQETGMSFYHIC